MPRKSHRRRRKANRGYVVIIPNNTGSNCDYISPGRLIIAAEWRQEVIKNARTV